MTIEQETHIAFVLVTHIKGMFFNPLRPEGLEFKPVGDCELRFVLKPENPKDACGTWGGLECKVYATYPATKDQVAFVDSYSNHKVMLRVADDISLPYKSKTSDKILINKDGSFKDFYPRRYLCPSDISQLIEHAESELSCQTDRFLKLLRWRQGIDAPGEVVNHRTLYWRVGEGEYPLAPPAGNPSEQTTIPGMFGIRWDGEYQKDLQEVWEEHDLTEPLGHVLVREAAALASESPRSSIMIMTTALETAVKIHISRIAPDTAWLMEEVPSPPIFKIFRDYIPLIHRNHGKEINFWDKVKPFLKKAEKLIVVRNKVAHTGKIPENAAPIRDSLVLVTDLLYLLDVLDGHEWAKSLASHQLRQALDWPAPKDGRFTITITEGY